MTIPELIAFTIGAALVGIAWMACHWATIARTAPRTPDPDPTPTRTPDRPTATALLPLARMSHKEVQQHLQRLKPDWTPPADQHTRLAEMQDRVNQTLTNLDAVDWDRNRAVWRNTDPFLRSHAEWIRRTESNPLDALGYTPEPCPEDCVCGAGTLPLPTVRTVDLSAPEPEPLEDR